MDIRNKIKIKNVFFVVSFFSRPLATDFLIRKKLFILSKKKKII